MKYSLTLYEIGKTTAILVIIGSFRTSQLLFQRKITLFVIMMEVDIVEGKIKLLFVFSLEMGKFMKYQ